MVLHYLYYFLSNLRSHTSRTYIHVASHSSHSQLLKFLQRVGHQTPSPLDSKSLITQLWTSKVIEKIFGKSSIRIEDPHQGSSQKRRSVPKPTSKQINCLNWELNYIINFHNPTPWGQLQSLGTYSELQPYLATMTFIHKLSRSEPNLQSQLPNKAWLWNLIFLIRRSPLSKGKQTNFQSTIWNLWWHSESFQRKFLNWVSILLATDIRIVRIER